MAVPTRIASCLLDAVLADARATPHYERCGLLLGHADHIIAHRPARNHAAQPEQAFAIDPAELIAAHRAARGAGLSVVGHYHFHPDGRCFPSSADAMQAHGDGALWLIVTMAAHGLWRATAQGPVRGAFAPVALAVHG